MEVQQMRQLLATLALLALAIPAAAAECTTLAIDHDAGSPRIESRSTQDPNVKVSIVGQFLQVQINDPEGGSYSDAIVSIEVDDATGATVCPDGTVTFGYPEVLEPSEASTAPEAEVVDLAVEYANHQPFIDALLTYRPF